MEGVYDKQKESAGGLATIVFLISALYFFIADGGVGSLFSLKALGFFSGGMFLAAIIIGVPTYFIQRMVTKVLMKTIKDPFSVGAIKKIQSVGIVLMIIQVAATLLITKVAYQWLIA